MDALIVEEDAGGRREITKVQPGYMAVMVDTLPGFRAVYALECSPDGSYSCVVRHDFELNVPVEDAKKRVFRRQHKGGIPIAVLRAWESCRLDCYEPKIKITAEHAHLQEVA